MEEKKIVGFVGAHMDDIELGCGGTIQVLRKRGYRCIGLVISTDPKREEATKKSSELLGYELILGGISEKEIDRVGQIQEIVYEKLIKPHDPFLIFGHTPKDDHHNHVAVSIGTDSACRRVKNLLHYCGPLRKWEFAPNIFFTFLEEEYKKKIQALEILGAAYGKTRYFTREYSMESAWLGQRLFEYEQRDLAPYIKVDGEKVLPYAEGFEARRLRDPF